MEPFEDKLKHIFEKYWDNFNQKNYRLESVETDVLMEAFGISQEMKQENKQYWGRELGMCWQLYGSGTTLVAAKELGFPYVGIEIEENYIPIIEDRLRNCLNLFMQA